MAQGFENRSIHAVVISEFDAHREQEGDWACCKVTITLTSDDGLSKGPEVQIDVGADVSLDMPFTRIEEALLERASQVLQRCMRETPRDLHAHWVRHSRETLYRE